MMDESIKDSRLLLLWVTPTLLGGSNTGLWLVGDARDGKIVDRIDQAKHDLISRSLVGLVLRHLGD
jgi:hypothetical protein